MENKIVIGCNYHTKWQAKSGMRFVLVEIKDGKARLQTRGSRKDFWTNVADLIFINSDYNKSKAARIEASMTPFNAELAEKLINAIKTPTNGK